ncbi:hypothetical protein [uncultured Roseobacter sp.]|uniref:hypothetical protein n=1 Tax=uncultured Roseobacter sp. TaxID=114847 RepID=UPI0026301F8F|nr:hypothetical protein [uncultured Roseobacter sp.]
MSTDENNQNLTTLFPVFRRADETTLRSGTSGYEALFETSCGDAWEAKVLIPAHIVESAVLNSVEFKIRLGPIGQIFAESDDLSDEALEALTAGLRATTLTEFLASALDPDTLAAEDHPQDLLIALAATLRRAIGDIETRLDDMKNSNR